MPWRAQSQPFQTVRNLPFVRRDLPTICEELGAMSLLPGIDRWSYGWLQLEPATSWIHPLMSAALLPVISQIRLPVWSARPLIIYYGNGKSPICRWFSYMIPIKCVFFLFFHCHVKLPEGILLLNLSACWFSHSFSSVSLQDLHKKPGQSPLPCCFNLYFCLVPLPSTASGWWLSPTPLKNMSSSVGMMTFPTYGTIKHVPNH